MSFASAPERALVRGGGPEGRGTATASAERGFSEANRRHEGRGTGKSMFVPGQNLSTCAATHRGLRRALYPSCYPILLPLSPLKWEECSRRIPGATEHFRRRRRAGGRGNEAARTGQSGAVSVSAVALLSRYATVVLLPVVVGGDGEGGDRVQHRRRVRVRVECRGQDAGAQRREGPGGDDRHRDGVGAGRSKGRPVTVSVNARSPAVAGAVKLGRAVSAPVSVTGAPLACVHA